MTDKRFLLKLFAIVTSFVYEVIVALAIGYGIGWLLDRWLKLENVFIIIMMVLWALAALRNLMVRVYRLGAEKK